MTTDDSVAMLTIKDTVSKDTQVYRIEVANKLGRVQATANLTVQCTYGLITIVPKLIGMIVLLYKAIDCYMYQHGSPSP